MKFIYLLIQKSYKILIWAQNRLFSQMSKTSDFSPGKLSFFSSMGFWMADMLLYPFDTLATRIKANKSQFSSLYHEIKHIAMYENISSLYRGFSSTFPCSFLSNIIYFMLYEQLNKTVKPYCHEKILYCLPLITSSFSELVALFFYLPFDIVRTRLQVNYSEYSYNGMIAGVNEIVKNEGLIRLYQASHLYLLNTCFYVGVQMWFYELLRSNFLIKNNKKSLNFKESFSVSFVVTVAATVLVNPLDVIFTRFQIIDSKKEKLDTMKIVKELVKNEGLRAFLKGLGAKILGNVSVGVVWLPLYDYFKGIYGADVYE